MAADDDEDDWEVEGARPGYIRSVSSVPLHRSRRRHFERGRALRVAAIAAVAIIAIIAVPAAVRWARDNLAEVTQTPATTTVPVTTSGP